MHGLIRQLILSALLGLLSLSAFSQFALAGDDWLPVAPEELKMASEPKAPGAAAIILFRQVDRNDVDRHEYIYARIKIFTEEGRKYGNIQIPSMTGFEVKNIQARTVHPDGSIINFDGKTYKKMVVKAKGVQFLAETLSMPDVQPGSIIEYRYTLYFPAGYVSNSAWVLSEELFTKHAKFSLIPNSFLFLQWSWRRGLPEGTPPPVRDQRGIHLEAQDIPAFPIEDYMPPIEELKYSVDFKYTVGPAPSDPDRFWKMEGQALYRRFEMFTDKRKAMEQAVAQIVSPTDTPEQKLQKIYARCQSLRNTSMGRRETKQEIEREKLKNIENVEEMWKRGYGNNREINLLFLALARAAGFDASPVLISTRDRYFFSPKLMQASDLDSSVVLVKLDGKDLYLSPGVAFAPFGLLPWAETGVQGLRLDKDGGDWIKTPLPEPSSSGLERKASLHLDDSGSLEGTVTLTFKGLSALRRRLDEHEQDATERKKSLEDELKGLVSVSAEVELTNKPDWDSSANTLVAEYLLKVPGWASAAGRRTLLPVGVFGGGEKHVFEHAARVHPVYFHYSYEDQDDVTIQLPPGWQVSSVPKTQNIDTKVCLFHTDAQSMSGSLHLNRQLTMKVLMFDQKYYGALQNFYQQVRTGDEQLVVLSNSDTAAQN